MIAPAKRRGPRRRRRNPVKWVVGLVLAFVIFAVGIAVGAALNDNPTPNLTVTTTKTLIP
jgi:hypothetical protein